MAQKLAFMDGHGISASVISLANPWLDFLAGGEEEKEEKEQVGPVAREVNDELEGICEDSGGRIFAFGVLPLSLAAAAAAGEKEEKVVVAVAEIKRLEGLPHIRGVILGTMGLGRGLDDERLDPVWKALEASRLLVFLHPHYGLPAGVFGPRANESGLVMALSMGFPMETTIGFVRMWLSGVFDRFPGLTMLIAHAGGTLPFLAGRVDSCVAHDRRLRDDTNNDNDDDADRSPTQEKEKKKEKKRPRRSIADVMRENVFLDAVTYSEIGTRASVEAVGVDRVLFGTDHPFFPPLDEGAKEWVSVRTNITAIEGALGKDESAVAAVLGGNAINLLKLDIV